MIACTRNSAINDADLRCNMAGAMLSVDVVVLSRDSGPLSPQVQRGLAQQRGIRIHLHRIVGAPQPGDANRWQTIARARNLGKRRGTSPWLMFLDDDVELDAGAILRLISSLRERPLFGALAADYGEHLSEFHVDHVTMGATLFRRSALGLFEFRWEPGRCECQCCCDDLRRHLLGIAYCSGVRARHWQNVLADDVAEPARPLLASATEIGRREPTQLSDNRACIFAAFDRRHLSRFRRQFIPSLRGSGNPERVMAVGYGLYPSEQNSLRQVPGLELLALPDNGISPAIRRLVDFQTNAAQLAPETPVAYWDAAVDFVPGSSRRPLANDP